jgi:hypothetical protein
MDNQHEEMQALINILRQQLHSALDAACSQSAKVLVLEAQIARLKEKPAGEA